MTGPRPAGSRLRKGLPLVAGGAALVAVLALALSSTAVRAGLKSSPALRRLNSPALRQVDAWLYNLRHEVPSSASLGDGRTPGTITLADPMGLGRDDEGTIYIADRGSDGPGHVVWAISGGSARVIAGTGRRGVARTGIQAVRADLGNPQGLCLDAEGRVYIADSYNHVILRIEEDGRLTRVAGNGTPGDDGDGGPATEASLNQPYDVRADARGNLFIADYGNHKIRKVTREGTIHTLAGTGTPGDGGDGGPAVAAQLRGPYGVYPDQRHGVLIADSENHVIRAIAQDGTIRRLAGTGERGHRGDGGPAIQASFDTPQAVIADAKGRVFIGDEHNHAIRMIDAAGIVHHVAGTGQPGFSRDGAPAQSARLNDPESMVLLPDGTLVLTEAGNHLVRMVRADGILITFAGGAR